jgi:tetratricopeptide (TPR) repeat protein
VAAARALALDSTSVEAQTSQAFISVFYDWDWPRAKREFDVALALDPRYSPAHLYHAWYFLATDQIDRAVEAVRTAVKLDPFSSVNNVRLATMLFFARRYADALDQGHRLLELDPTFFQVHAELGRAYLGMNRCAEALAELERPPAHLATLFRGVLGYAYARCGRRAEALSEIRRLEGETKAGHYVSPYAFAMIHAALGDNDRAFAELDSAYAERATTMYHLKVEPAFDQMRSDPRFTRLVSRVGLAQ